MHQVTVYVDPTGHSAIGWSQAAGMPGDTRFLFRTPGNFAYPGIAEMKPQLVLRPFTTHTANAYDIDINDPTGAAGIATIPGSVMNDRMQIEVYERNSIDQPVRLLASGRVEITGYGYVSQSPLSPATYAQGPAGPAGEDGTQGVQGEQGVRGSRWYTAAGPPTGPIPDERVNGDMYLDEVNGDGWRWDGVTWSAFRGV